MVYSRETSKPTITAEELTFIKTHKKEKELKMKIKKIEFLNSVSVRN